PVVENSVPFVGPRLLYGRASLKERTIEDSRENLDKHPGCRNRLMRVAFHRPRHRDLYWAEGPFWPTGHSNVFVLKCVRLKKSHPLVPFPSTGRTTKLGKICGKYGRFAPVKGSGLES